jgi:hypothetical protein
MGYAFINFIRCHDIVSFYETFNGKKWPNFNSEKVCMISYARLQGKAAMITRFQNSTLLEKHESYRPLVFSSSGPNKGQLEPFPAPKTPKPPLVSPSFTPMNPFYPPEQLFMYSTGQPPMPVYGNSYMHHPHPHHPHHPHDTHPYHPCINFDARDYQHHVYYAGS